MKKINIKLEPLGKIVKIEPGGYLQDILFEYGIEFPCGGDGICGKCKVRLIKGNLAINDIQRQYFTDEELADGWRLACQCRVTEPVTLELIQWEMQILSDNKKLKTSGQNGFTVAVDLGTTTLVVQLIDLSSGFIRGTKTALNPQAQHGADVMSRIEFALSDVGAKKLRQFIRNIISEMVMELINELGHEDIPITRVVIVGNTAMHHLFCGVDVTPLSKVPFETKNDGEFVWQSTELGWNLPGNPAVRFLPCLGGFVGSDIMAGIIATELYLEEELTALIDLGTNGEIVVGNKNQILCASTAAGPAFEGAKISMGMRAVTGAISKAVIKDGQIEAHVIGGGRALGICGSGLVDVVACALDLGLIDKSGKILNMSGKIEIRDAVFLIQQDIRELQLAKAAIAAGLEILIQRFSSMSDIGKIHIAGAFGNYINIDNAKRIGLLNSSFTNFIQAGNTALHGAKEIVIGSKKYQLILELTRHVSLGTDAEFMDMFVDNMNFP